MRTKKNRYKEMEQTTTLVLLADLILFIFYLIAAANGIVWLKLVLFILTFVASVLCLVFLYYAGELTKQRSFWMTTGFASIAFCVLLAFILNFPSPAPYNTNTPSAAESTAATTTAPSTDAVVPSTNPTEN